MAKPQIIVKLNDLIIATHEWTEVEVTYLFVQTRKLLDHHKNDTKSSSYSNLRFYCDWIVHIDKDRINSNTLNILRDFESGMKLMIGNSNIHAPGPINFAYFESLQAEIVDFLKTQEVESGVFRDNDIWVNVICGIVRVLENQPLRINSSHGMLIKTIEFLPSAPRTVWLRAIFNEKFEDRNGNPYDYFDLKNAY